MIKSRELVSFDGQCQFHCKHCYTYELPQHTNRKVEEIVDSLKDKTFDIVYVSQKNENFSDPERGIELCEKIFQKYACNIFIITRNVIPKKFHKRLVNLNETMRQYDKTLFVGSSVIGLESSKISEDLCSIPSPTERIEFLKDIFKMNIHSLLLIRPLFPSKIIPSNEIEQLVNNISGCISCVVTGPLMVNDSILKRLNLRQSDLEYIDGGESEYLNGAIKDSMKFVDVKNEMAHLKQYCSTKNIPCFEHSLPAINYLINSQEN